MEVLEVEDDALEERKSGVQPKKRKKRVKPAKLQKAQKKKKRKRKR